MDKKLMMQLIRSEDINHAAKAVFIVIWEFLGFEPGMIEKMSVHRIATMCGLSEGQTRHRIESLEKCGLFEREYGTKGQFTLYVYQPFAPRIERPKKVKPTPLLDIAENHSGNHSEIQSETRCENRSEKPSEKRCEKYWPHASRLQPVNSSELPNSCQTPKISQESREMGERLERERRKRLAEMKRSSPRNPEKSLADSMPDFNKKTEPVYISNDSIDYKYLNSIDTIDVLLRKHQKVFEQAHKLAPAKEQAYLSIMVVLMFDEGVLQPDQWRQIYNRSSMGDVPGACLQVNLGKICGRNDMERFRSKAKSYYMEKTDRVYKRQLAGVR